MRQIHSWNFQICGTDEYWQIPYVKVSFPITYQFMRERPKMLTNIRYSPILANSPRIGVCAVPPLESPLRYM